MITEEEFANLDPKTQHVVLGLTKLSFTPARWAKFNRLLLRVRNDDPKVKRLIRALEGGLIGVDEFFDRM